MSTDKIQALHNTVVEILSEPPSPPTFFDEEPHDAAQASEQVAKTSGNLRREPEIPKEHLGKLSSRELGISPKKIHEAHIVRDAENESPNESPGIARQALAEQTPVGSRADAGNRRFSKLAREAESHRSEPRTASVNPVRPAVSGTKISLGGWALRGFAGILLAAGIGAAANTWLGSRGDAAKSPLPQPALPAPTAAVLSPELTPLLQSMARDLASMGKEIEQLKAGRELVARDNANVSELTRGVARLSEQLKASQEQVARDNANVAEQIKAIQDQLGRIISQASEHNAPPRVAAASPRPAAPVVRKPVPLLSSPQATAQPKAEKPKLSSTSRPPAPPPAPAR
jgi:hypothetical protein